MTGSLNVPAVLERRDGFAHHWEDGSQWGRSAEGASTLSAASAASPLRLLEAYGL